MNIHGPSFFRRFRLAWKLGMEILLARGAMVEITLRNWNPAGSGDEVLNHHFESEFFKNADMVKSHDATGELMSRTLAKGSFPGVKLDDAPA